MKKKWFVFCICIAMAFTFVGCGNSDEDSTAASTTTAGSSGTAGSSAAGGSDTQAATGGSASGMTGPISVISREDGSGTRGAFIELFGIEQKDASGNKVDNTTDEAIISNSTSVMMTTVAGDTQSIGYISLGSLNDSVKALKVDGVEATVENINDGSYQVARPFLIATQPEASDVAKDFIDFIMSADGQKVIEENGYIKASENPAYQGSKPSGKVVVAGSSSVAPVMEKLKEAYVALNPNAEIEVQQNDSSTGITSVINKSCDIGMASRELKEEESAQGIVPTEIAKDGIAVVVNLDNPFDGLTKDQIQQIFTGALTKWDEVAQ